MKRITIIILALASMLVFALTGCSATVNFTAQSFSSADNTVNSVVIDVIDQEITVSLSKDNQIHIDYYESENEFFDVSITKDNRLEMKFSQDKEWKYYIGKKPSLENRKINIQIPSALISELKISTTNEKIILTSHVFADSISLSSSDGNIEFEQINIRKSLYLTAKNGNIKGTVIGSYDIFSIACEIKKGECNLPIVKKDGEKALIANCNNGNIEIDFVKE